MQNDLDTARAVNTATRCNDLLYDLTKRYPTRFKAFGNLAFQNPVAAALEAERCIKELGFVGFMVNGATNFHYYDEPQFYPIWAKG
ncbi:amidohydrolase family protein [Anaerocolumna sp. MB42-C2]|uniref:amidohydrolase family protein n=1 Tax=Anaerocolumna sp. MB42-C2 TaxID=3070997 RepID=UPI003FA431CE